MLVNAPADPYGASRGHACVYRTSACGAGPVSRPRRSGLRARQVPSACPDASRGPALSSAILYLAIVAIWAGVLVPRWLRPHASRTADTEQVADPSHHEDLEPPGERTQTGHEARYSAARSYAGQPRAQPEQPQAQPDQPRAQPDQRRAPVHPSPADRHAHVLQARRRKLATLVLLTAGAVAIAVAHLAATWVIIPPAVMLAGFLMLLRGAARIDAKRMAHSAHATAGTGTGQEADTGRHAAQTQDAASAPNAARSARPAQGPSAEPEWEQAEPGWVGAERGWVAAEPGWVAAAAPDWTPSAEIIDISGRMRDQVYDQYSDAAERAVGD